MPPIRPGDDKLIWDQDKQAWVKDEPLMTGQEWYDKFENEFKGWPSDTQVNVEVNSILDAAKKAAGIEL